eukprot:5988774-Alexandrium_andersonii.AAC.2
MQAQTTCRLSRPHHQLHIDLVARVHADMSAAHRGAAQCSGVSAVPCRAGPCGIDMQACGRTGMQAHRHACMQACRHAGKQACKHAGLQACRHAGMQVHMLVLHGSSHTRTR